ncbi:MAG: FAD-dependent monooxygenase [Salaquimonas sp.]
MPRKQKTHYPIAVIGGGIVGLTAMLGLVRQGKDCILISPEMTEPDGKTSALLAQTVDFLDTLDIWIEASSFAYPLKTMRIIDGTKRLIRAPQTDFNASEIKRDAFGYNIENKKLGALLNSKLENFAEFQHLKSELISIESFDAASDKTTYKLETQSGSIITADIVIACDGRNSIVRTGLQIGERSWQYPQIALVGNFTHTLPNNDTSTEFHAETGPFTLVPLGSHRSSLVCVVNQSGADTLLATEPEQLNLHLEQKMQSILGKVQMEGQLKSFPLSGMVAKSFAKGSALLAGEAAHVFPPIGAQGLNLGLRDVASLLKLLASSNISPSEIGAEYQKLRAADILARTASVDILNRSLLSDFLPVQAGRSFGLFALGSLGSLRRFMMREGIAPGTSLKPELPKKNPLEFIADKIRSSRST